MAAGFSSRKPGFNSREAYMGFEVEEETQKQVLSYLVFTVQILFYKSSIFVHLSSGTGEKTRPEVLVAPRCILTN